MRGGPYHCSPQRTPRRPDLRRRHRQDRREERPMSETSEDFFFLIDTDGRRRIPFKQRNRTDGRYGYSILPIGKGNDPSAGEYTEDPIRLVQRVVLENQLVRAKVAGGK